MYYYIVNPNAGNGTFADIQHKLKSTLRELDIDGEFAKTLEKKDARKITRSALKRDIKTLVVIGGDKTVNEVIAAVNESGNRSVSIGIIPTGTQNTLANFLGVHDWQHACRVLATRRLQSFNLVHINDHNFIHSCSITPKDHESTSPMLTEIDGVYKIRGEVALTTITNQKLHNAHLPNQLLLRFWPPGRRTSWWDRLMGRGSEESPPTQLHGRVAIMEFSAEHTAAVDGRTLHNTLFRIRLSDIPVRLIVARNTREEEEERIQTL